MKLQKFIAALLIVITITLLPSCSCSSLIECESISQRQLTMLVDVSDSILFNGIDKDIQTNFPVFMQKSKLGNVSPCQSFTLSFAHLSSQEALELSSETIKITRKRQSQKEENKEANPAPLIKLLTQKMDDDYRLLSKQPEMTTGSNIANVLLKAINQSNPDAENVIILFSDMVENNAQLNLYKKIPDKKDIPQVMEKLIEPSVMEKFKQLQQEGLQIKIVLVLKPEPAGKANQRNIKIFWTEVFKALKLNVQIVDNLSNQIQV